MRWFKREYEYKYKLVFITKDKSLRYKTDVKVLKILENELDYKKGTYHIDIENPSYMDGNTFVYFMDTISGKQLTFEESGSILNPSQFKTILRGNILKQLVQGITKGNEKVDWYSIIIGIMIGLFVGIIATYFFMQGKFDELVQQILNQEQQYPF